MTGEQKFYRLLKPVCITTKYCPYTAGEVVKHHLDAIKNEIGNFDAILGNDFIPGFHWYFDYKKQRFLVKPR